jgi:chemotaxis methyl-accepting protein methylase
MSRAGSTAKKLRDADIFSMKEKTSTIIESLAGDAIASALSVRFDICTCPVCRKDILTNVMRAVRPLNDDTEGNTADDIMRTVRAKYLGEINHAILSAVEAVNLKPSHPQTEDRKKTFKLLLQKILQERSLDFRSYHTELLKRRFALRIKANSLFSYTDYMKLLDRSPGEYDKLFETLCINVSEFFRDPPLWVTLQYMLENMITGKFSKSEPEIVVWSAGCACGEEAYSLAITLSEALRFHEKHVHARIIATDIDRECLAAAHKAQYSGESIKNVNDKLLVKYFMEQESGAAGAGEKNKLYSVREPIRKMVTFSSLDLINADYPKNIDLLLCRNVFIYFDRQLQEKILKKFSESIRPGGYLCMGLSESMLMEVRKLFEDTDSNARIYRKS